MKGYIIALLMLLPLRVAADNRGGQLMDKADSLYALQQYDEALRLAEEALPACRGQELEADCLNLLAIIHVRKGNFGEAATYAKQCNALDMQTGDPDAISSSLNTLAGIYMSMRQPEEAEKYILKAIGYGEKAGNPQRLAVLHGMASEVYHHLKQEEQSLDYATKAYQMERQLGRTDRMTVRQAERAAALIALDRHQEAREALAEAIPGLRQSGNLHSLGIACNQMGDLMHRQQNDSAAVCYYSEALIIFTAQHDLFNEASSRRGLYEALRKSDPEQAMTHNDRYNQLRDSLYDEKTGELLSKYAAEYGYDELQTENDEMQKMHRRAFIVGGAILLALLIGTLLLYQWMRRREQQHTEQLIRRIQELTAATADDAEAAEHAEAAEEAGPAEETEDHLFLMRVVKAVNDGLPSGRYGVEDIASELNMSSQTFRRRLLKVTGDSPKSFISAIQMERAANLLKMSPDMPVSEVAMRCGYEETTSFTRAFRKAYGVPPSQYRA